MNSTKLLRLLFLALTVLLPVFLFNNEWTAYFQQGLMAIMGALTLLWVLSLIIKDSSIIDIFWGSGFIIVAWTYAYIIGFENLGTRHFILLGMVTLWGLRLSTYLGMRNIGKGEDYRYVQWRKEHGKNWWWVSYLRVFLLQGIILWIVSAALLPALLADGGLQTLDYIGILIWAIGLYFEAVGDYQLMQFKKDPNNKGKVLDTGVWKYTRHPNYFGDAFLWWGFFCFALAHASGIFYIFSPIFMTFLLLKISGVAMLEKSLKVTKPKYADYIKRTSAFIPMPPKN